LLANCINDHDLLRGHDKKHKKSGASAPETPVFISNQYIIIICFLPVFDLQEYFAACGQRVSGAFAKKPPDTSENDVISYTKK